MELSRAADALQVVCFASSLVCLYFVFSVCVLQSEVYTRGVIFCVGWQVVPKQAMPTAVELEPPPRAQTAKQTCPLLSIPVFGHVSDADANHAVLQFFNDQAHRSEVGFEFKVRNPESSDMLALYLHTPGYTENRALVTSSEFSRFRNQHPGENGASTRSSPC